MVSRKRVENLKSLDMVVHPSNPSPWKTEARGSPIQRQPGYMEKKEKKWDGSAAVRKMRQQISRQKVQQLMLTSNEGI